MGQKRKRKKERNTNKQTKNTTTATTKHLPHGQKKIILMNHIKDGFLSLTVAS